MKEKFLFDLIQKIGEGIYTSLHILDITDSSEDIIRYRIYHSEGYCFSIEREEIDDLEAFNDEFGDINVGSFYYGFQCDEFDGFKKLDVNTAINLLSNYIN